MILYFTGTGNSRTRDRGRYTCPEYPNTKQ